jgi:hypothetical protein
VRKLVATLVTGFAVALAALTLTGCPDDDELDEVIREYMDIREDRSELRCQCFTLFGYESESACLDEQARAYDNGIDDNVECLKSAVRSAGLDEDAQLELFRCYNAGLLEENACRSEHASTCASPEFTDCGRIWTKAKGHCDFDQRLTDDQVSEINNCSFL